ncbi:metallothiol transferase fosB [Bacillus glycinifermentans]|uniref:Metallothiol transferase FosB n=1 Tax=Bacillus glycinifermentans TaxID=1664069 RepID=A0A0J6H343_9BACI|nr:metallothiol transferase FosB [Bacillus glycinifermentans]ATH95290.1 metallothiol transferase fosB [Bacillus glycinifermentans]KMM58090.1 metallothiol transferase fosB [Bacillus glycinifermentans]KRT91442.1 metallothiol transferase fosB [Bacillus glycinifermentans]MEC0486987.1 metallothiol transferase FosB [Bacillus glycinifermentans]MEC0495287.1 metallothiol transferase FosB [Bacillus glycinifermentans]
MEGKTIQGLNHLLFSVSDLSASISFYEKVFDAKWLVKAEKTAYFDLNGIWLALNEEKDIKRTEIHDSYTHIAFSIKQEDLPYWEMKLHGLGVNVLKGRKRHEGDKDSIYFSDPDGHKFELHTGTLLDRLAYYQKEKPHLSFHEANIRELYEKNK